MLRNEIGDKYKWDLSSIIPNDESWEEIFIRVNTAYGELLRFKGKLDNSDNIYACLKAEDEISCDIGNLYVYARMKLDEDANVSMYQAMTDRIEMLSVKISSVLSFVMPELSKLDNSVLLDLIKEPRYSEYDYALSNIIRSKPHVLSEKEEKLLSEVKGFSGGFHDAFNMFDNADIRFESIVSDNGEKIELSHGKYGSILQSGSPKEREQAFCSMFNSFKNMNNTLAQIYIGNVRKNVFFARARKHESALAKAMFGENVSKEVYQKLIACVSGALPLLHEYITFRKQALGVNELHSWDLHIPIVDGTNISLEYSDAYDLVKTALLPLGKDYAELLDTAYNNKWIDVYETKGKRSGAYSWGTYTSHPYVLLNYQPVTHDVFTIAHELGHAMHSYYSNAAQPYAKAGYEIFVAEVASTVNEVLLLKHLIKSGDDKMRKYMLSYYLDMFRTTLFRQTQFAKFEQLAHETAEREEPLTAQSLNVIYKNLNEEFYGKDLESDELIQYEWSRIPHFYRSFYVYKYATGLTSAVKIANAIFNNENGAVEKYKQFLSLGGSMPPEEILKVAGVDLAGGEPYEVCMSEFKSTLKQLKTYTN